MRHTMRTLLVVLVALVALAAMAHALTLQVEPKTSECFYQEFEENKGVKVFWQVVRGGLLDVLVQIRYEGDGTPGFSPQLLHEKLHFEGEGEGIHEFRTGAAGIYSVCFNNEMARFTAKVVRFRIITAGQWGTDVDGSDSDAKSPMERAARRISEEMDLLELHQQYMRQREIRHRQTQESTNSRVFWMSIIESLFLISISIGQVYMIRRFFTTKRSGV